MFVYLVASFCLAGTCEAAIVASSEHDPLLTMRNCQTVSQAAIAGWMANSLKYRNWDLSGYSCVQGDRAVAG